MREFVLLKFIIYYCDIVLHVTPDFSFLILHITPKFTCLILPSIIPIIQCNFEEFFFVCYGCPGFCNNFINPFECEELKIFFSDAKGNYCQCCTGTKFFVVCEPGTQHMENLLKVIYELYSDYVLKNPFYEMEMPIRCELFDINLSQAIQKDRVAFLGR